MALIYPLIVFVTGLVLLGVFMVFLLPQLTSLLTKTGRQLPLVTQLLIGTSQFFSRYWWALLLAAGLAFGLHKWWIATPSGRATWDRLKLRLPLVGLILKQQFLAQFLETLATLLSNGVALLNALVLVGNATANTHIKALIGQLAEEVGEGMALSRSMKKSGFFPAVLIDIIAVGEQTGRISEALQRGAERYDKEFTLQIQRMTVLIQPITILFVALFVGVVAYSMITGILTTVSGLRMH
jgi:type II secretory pathway component PulF